jgi:hypothetical protein
VDHECRHVHRAHHDSRILNRSVARVFLVLILAAVAALAAPPGKQIFTGVITDSMCEDGDHSHMRMGPTDAECTKACVEVHGASYVLYDGKQAYTLSDQKTPEKFAGKKVTVNGTLDAKTKTIRVDSIAAAK